MTNVTAILPLQLLCQLLNSQNASVDTVMQQPKLAMDLPVGYTVFPEIGTAYKYYAHAITWNEGRKYCIAEGASLAHVDTYEKKRYAQSLQKPGSIASVGYHRLFDIDEWIDLRNGTPTAGLPWMQNSYRDEPSRKCMRLHPNGVYASSCTAKYGFICEIEL